MKVRLLTSMAGPGCSYVPGEIAEIDDETAQRLLDSGQAEAVTPAKKTRKAVKPPPEETRESDE